MRIAVVHSFYDSSVPSGENQVVAAQVKALSDAGHDVRLFSRYTTECRDRESFYAVRAGLSTATGIGPSPRDELGMMRPDIVHVHNLFPNWGQNWIRRWPGPIVATLHNYRTVCASGLLWRDGSNCFECLEHGSQRAVVHRCYKGSAVATVPLSFSTAGAGKHSQLLQRARRVITLNSSALAFFSSLLEPDRVVLIPNFLEDSVGRRGGDRRAWAFAGRLTHEKGILRLLEMWPDSENLVVAGTGPLEEEVRSRIAGLPNVQFLGPVPAHVVQSLLGRVCGLVLPSLWAEGLPTVALEALRAGTPVVASDRCAAASAVTAGGAGAIYSTDAAESLQWALDSIGSSADAGRLSRSLFERSYSEASWVASINGLYETVLANYEH